MTRIGLRTTERTVMAIVAAVAIVVAVGIVAIISPVWPSLPRMMGQIAVIAIVMWFAIGTCVLIIVFAWAIVEHTIQQAARARLNRR